MEAKTVSEFNKNLRSNQGNLKQHKPQQRKRANQTPDISPYLLINRVFSGHKKAITKT